MKTVLVSGASGVVGYGILRSLQKSKCKVRLIGTTIYEDSVAQGFCDIFEKAPYTNDKSYSDWLLGVIDKYQVDMMIPGIEVDMYHWNEMRSDLISGGTLPVLNKEGLLLLCKDKWLFYKELKKLNVSCAIESTLCSDFHTLKSSFGLPFLLKPRCGFGSKGIVRVENEVQFNKYKADMGSVLMAQPIVGNEEEEYTISAFCDGKGGYFACMALRRKLSKDGYTDRAETVSFDMFEPEILDLCSRFKPLGPTNFQFRWDGENAKLLEINPRISSSTSIRSSFGYNESEMCMEYFLKGTLPTQPEIRRGHAIRYIEDYMFL